MTIRPTLPDGLQDSTLERVERAVLDAARPLLTARRYLPFEGPLGGGIVSLQVGARLEHRDREVQLSGRRALAIPTIDSEFVLPIDEVEAAQRFGQPLPTLPAELAGERVALAEERVIYRGVAELAVHGLLDHPGVARVPLAAWDEPGDAVDNVIAAADLLDAAGASGPFALALAPSLYNALFRKYEDSDVLALDHLARLAARGIFKAHVLDELAVLVSPQVGPLVCGRDLHVRYLETRANGIRFVATSAIVLRFDLPHAVCVLGPKT